MFDQNYLFFYVENPVASAAFYSERFGSEPLEASPTFALFALPSGLKFGLWGKKGVKPEVVAFGTSCELAFAVDSNQQVETIHKDWQGRGVTIAQPPVQMDFGYTFTALDPDGHRLRIFCLSNH